MVDVGSHSFSQRSAPVMRARPFSFVPLEQGDLHGIGGGLRRDSGHLAPLSHSKEGDMKQLQKLNSLTFHESQEPLLRRQGKSIEQKPIIEQIFIGETQRTYFEKTTKEECIWSPLQMPTYAPVTT